MRPRGQPRQHVSPAESSAPTERRGDRLPKAYGRARTPADVAAARPLIGQARGVGCRVPPCRLAGRGEQCTTVCHWSKGTSADATGVWIGGATTVPRAAPHPTPARGANVHTPVRSPPRVHTLLGAPRDTFGTRHTNRLLQTLTTRVHEGRQAGRRPPTSLWDHAGSVRAASGGSAMDVLLFTLQETS